MEKWLLASKLSQLHDCLRPGLTYLNWHALGTQDFVTPVIKVGGFMYLILNHPHSVPDTCPHKFRNSG